MSDCVTPDCVTPECAIEVSSLTKCFGRKTALNNLTFQVPRGGVHALLGRNGAGKTTLFRVLLGLLHPTSGSGRVLGMESGALTPETRGKIGFVGEEHALPGWMTVTDLVAMQRALYPGWKEETLRGVLEPFQVDGDQKVSSLSRGERAGVSLALALAQNPELLILDEPTLGLDIVAQHALMESVLFMGAREAVTILYCSHQMGEVERVADNLMILQQGELVAMAPPEDFQSRVSGWLTTWPEMPTSELQVSEIPGLLQWRDLGEMRELIVIDQDEGFSEVLERLGATDVQAMPLGFDRAVGALLSRRSTAVSRRSTTCGI